MPEMSRGNQCECTGCGEFFNSVYGFDKHRVFMDKDARGRYIEDWDRRRCLTVAEMKAKGWSLNDYGFWVTKKMSEEAKRSKKQQRKEAA